MTDPLHNPAMPATPPEVDADGQPLETAPLDETAIPGDAIPHDNLHTLLEKERDEWKDKAFRAAAEAENTKRRAAQEAADARQYAISKFAADVLGVGDNLARALAAPEGNEKALREGILMTATQLQSMLGRHGVQAIAVKPGDTLNPELHQAMTETPTTDHAPGTIVQELQAGFTIGGRLLRPALVVVAKTPEQGQ